MIKVNLETCLPKHHQRVTRHGRFRRVICRLPSAGPVANTVTLFQDRITGGEYTWGTLSVPVSAGQEFVIHLKRVKQQFFHSAWGLLIEFPERTCYLPVSPRLLVLGKRGRICQWHSLAWSYECENASLMLKGKAFTQGVIELPFVQTDVPSITELKQWIASENETWAVEGCWSSIQTVTDVWNFLCQGKIYCGKLGKHGRFPSAQTAWSLYKILSVLHARTDKLFYRELMAEIAYTMLNTLGDDGRWESGAWREEGETHLRFQIEGVHLLLSAYEEFGDKAFLRGVERSAQFVLQMKDELEDGGWWFLHDTLELDPNMEALQEHYPFLLMHRAFGKRPSTTMTLNTHVQAVTLLHRIAQNTGRLIYQEAYARSLQALEQVLRSDPGHILHRLAEEILQLSFETRPASLPRRAIRHFIRRHLRANLIRIQPSWPRFVTPGGYLWRDLTLPLLGYWYHLVNLYDLLVLHHLDPHPWLRKVIDQAMAFALRSDLPTYLRRQRHYVYPQWLQILKAYTAIDDKLNDDLLENTLQQAEKSGYGIPPEVYTTTGSFLTSESPYTSRHTNESQSRSGAKCLP